MAEQSNNRGLPSKTPRRDDHPELKSIIERANQLIHSVYKDLDIGMESMESYLLPNPEGTNEAPAAALATVPAPAPAPEPAPQETGAMFTRSRAARMSEVVDRVAAAADLPSRKRTRSGISTNYLEEMESQIERVNRNCEEIDRELKHLHVAANNFSIARTTPPLSRGVRRLAAAASSFIEAMSPSGNGESTNPFRPLPRRRSSRGRVGAHAPSATVTSATTTTNSTATNTDVISIPTDADRGSSRRSNPRNEYEDILAIVDVTSPPNRRTTNNNNNTSTNDDDLVYVSSTMMDVIDLCTPQNSQRNRRRNNNATGRGSFADMMVEIHNMTGGPSNRGRMSTFWQEEVSPPTAPSAQSKKTGASPPKNTKEDGPASSYKCPICMEGVSNPTTTSCGHVFCACCIHSAVVVTPKCPLCNTLIKKRSLMRIFL